MRGHRDTDGECGGARARRRHCAGAFPGMRRLLAVWVFAVAALCLGAEPAAAQDCGNWSYPVLCSADDTGATPRMQDIDGWANTPDCWDFPVADTVYEVEVRCQANPFSTDLR